LSNKFSFKNNFSSPVKRTLNERRLSQLMGNNHLKPNLLINIYNNANKDLDKSGILNGMDSEQLRKVGKYLYIHLLFNTEKYT